VTDFDRSTLLLLLLWLIFNRSIFSEENYIRLGPLTISQRRTFGNCWCKMF